MGDENGSVGNCDCVIWSAVLGFFMVVLGLLVSFESGLQVVAMILGGVKCWRKEWGTTYEIFSNFKFLDHILYGGLFSSGRLGDLDSSWSIAFLVLRTIPYFLGCKMLSTSGSEASCECRIDFELKESIDDYVKVFTICRSDYSEV